MAGLKSGWVWAGLAVLCLALRAAAAEDLIADFPAALSGAATTRLDAADPAAAPFFTDGWGQVRHDPWGNPFLPCRSRDATVEVLLAHVDDLTLRLRIHGPERSGRMPRQTLEVLWNGRPVGTHVVKSEYPHWAEFEVPAAVQQAGPNRVEIMPLYWLAVAEGGDRNMVDRDAFHLYHVEVRQARPEACVPATAARLEAEGLVQYPGSVVAWHGFAPESGRLEVAGRLTGTAGMRTGRLPEGGVSVHLHAAETPGRVLASASWEALAGGAAIRLEVPLGLDAGTPLGIALTSSLVGEATLSDRFRVAWETVRVTGAPPEPAAEVAPPRRPRNVCLVLFDALRADHVEPYGAGVTRTPRLADFSAQGVTFLETRAASSWTRPSVASLLTGLDPALHGARGNSGPLRAEVPYLPALLKARGFATLLVTENPQNSADFGFARGFEAYHAAYEDRERVEAIAAPKDRAADLWDRYVEPFLSRRGEGPFFLEIHAIDPHHPYAPPPPYDTLYGAGYRGNISNEQFYWRDLIEKNRMVLEAQDVAHLQALYRGEVSFMDAFFGAFMDRMNAAGHGEDTLFVFLSDHGEEFLEHGQITHGKSLYEEVLRVPWMMACPGVLPAGRRIDTPVALSDLARTVTDLLGLAPDDGLGGSSLAPLALGGEAGPPRPCFASQRLQRAAVDEDAVVYRGWKLIGQRPFSAEFGAAGMLLYDLGRDPGEYTNRWGGERLRGLAMAQLLREHEAATVRGGAETAAETALDPETVRQLEALGYVAAPLDNGRLEP